MKQSGISRSFISACIVVLLASYVVGLGIQKVRFAAAKPKTTVTDETEKPAGKADSGSDEVVTGKDAAEPYEQAEEPAAEPGEDVAAQPEQSEGRRMRGGMSERFQNMSEEERQAAIAEMRERGRMRMEGRGRGGGAFSQLSEEDREKFRAEMEELRARSEGMTDEERQQATNEIFEKYGITPGFRRPGGGGDSGGRRGGRE